MKRKLIAGAAISLLLGASLMVPAQAQDRDRGGRGGGDGPQGGGGGGAAGRVDGPRMDRSPGIERQSQPRVERRERAEPRQIERQTPRRVEREQRDERQRVQRQEQRRDAERRDTQRRDARERDSQKREAVRKQERDRKEARGNERRDQQKVRNIQATNEQRVRVREHVYREPNVRRLSRREFGGNFTVGSRVHRRHRLHHLTPAILVFAPFYRGYEYIIVEDTICIVDPETYVIVDVIPASLQYAEGSSRAQLALSAGDMRFVYAAVPKEDRADVRVRLALGASVPERVDLMRFPGSVIERVPQLEGFRYIVAEDDVVVVDPADRSVALVITE
jgi:hypothetical protein